MTVKRAPEFQVNHRAVPKELFPAGRVRFSLGTTKRTEAQKRKAALKLLVTWRAWDILHQLHTGKLDPGNVAAAVKERGESALAEFRLEERREIQRAEEARLQALEDSIPTVDAERAAYLAWYASGRREEHSLKMTTSRLKNFCDVKLGGTRVGDLHISRLTGPMVESAINERWKTSTTRENIRSAVSGLHNWSVEQERVRSKLEGRAPRWDENPASQVEAYEKRPRVVTAAEKQAIALLENAELYQAAYIRVFLHMGLREDELVHTRLHLDLDTETWVWKIQGRGPDERCGCLQCRGSGWTPKTKRSWRTLLVPAQPAGLRRAILDYLESYPCEPGDFVFRNPRTNRVWGSQGFDNDFHGVCDRAGVTYGRPVPGGITLHDLRATCATRLVQAKERESVIAALLGDTVQTIVKTYVRLTESDTAKAIAAGPAYEVTE